jgi:hypothetical protein
MKGGAPSRTVHRARAGPLLGLRNYFDLFKRLTWSAARLKGDAPLPPQSIAQELGHFWGLRNYFHLLGRIWALLMRK